MFRVYSSKITCVFFLFSTAMAISSQAQTFATLASFDGNVGSNPLGALVQRLDGNFYGTTYDGTFWKSGSVYQITPDGTLTRMHYFCSRANCADGGFPQSSLVLGTLGIHYGTTSLGGATSYGGTVFEITAGGTVITLHSFDGTDGASPYAGVVQGSDGNFYGTTVDFGGGYGTVFRMTPDGTVTTLHNFTGTDGSAPFGGLVQASNGNFYGTTTEGGNLSACGGGCGTVFEITPDGTFTTLHMFNEVDGMNPYDALVQASDGSLYGTTFLGGGGSGCVVGLGCGTLFKITTDGKFTKLHCFDGTDGGNPQASLIQATDGDLYGTTTGNSVGTGAFFGSIFKIAPGGKLTNLHTFSGVDGADPLGALLQAPDGNLYGTTVAGGANSCGGSGCGTVFRLSTGMGPFVTLVPTAREVGRRVRILGFNLSGATKVTFNGKPAAFIIVSATQICATVPRGATTGIIQVTTPQGTLSSNVSLRVL